MCVENLDLAPLSDYSFAVLCMLIKVSNSIALIPTGVQYNSTF